MLASGRRYAPQCRDPAGAEEHGHRQSVRAGLKRRAAYAVCPRSGRHRALQPAGQLATAVGGLTSDVLGAQVVVDRHNVSATHTNASRPRRPWVRPR